MHGKHSPSLSTESLLPAAVVSQVIQMLCFWMLAVVGAAGRESYARGILAGSYLLVAALEVVATVGYAVEGRPREAAAMGLLPLPALVLGVGVWVAERRILTVLALVAAAYVFVLVRRVRGCRRRRRAAAARLVTTWLPRVCAFRSGPL